MPHLPRSSPEGATTEWTVIAPADEAYYSFIDPVRMKGWVGLVGYPSAAGPVQTSESSPVRDRRSTTEPPNQRYVILNSTVSSCVFIAKATVTYSLGNRLHTFTAVPRPTQPPTCRGTVKWLSAFWLSNTKRHLLLCKMIAAYRRTHSLLVGLSPVSTTRVHGPSTRPVNSCTRVLGPWTRVAETGL